MNYTATAICNMALDEIKAQNIVSLNENSREAEKCRRWYPQALGEVLEATNWGFARTRTTLALRADNDRASEWAYAYALPADIAVPIRLVPPQEGVGDQLLAGQRAVTYSLSTDAPIPYEWAGQTFYTNLEGAVLEHVTTSPDTGTLPAKFVECIRFNLAAKLVVPIKGSRSEQTDLMQKAQVMMERAAASNHNRQPQSYGNFIPDAIKARMGGDVW